MMTQVTGFVQGRGWEETSCNDVEGGPRMTHAHFTNVYSGGIEGQASGDYVMVYPGDTATFAGYVRIVGAVGKRMGSFVVRHDGDFKEGAVHTTFSVVTGSGTGDLVDLTGEGSYVARHDVEETPFTFAYSHEVAS